MIEFVNVTKRFGNVTAVDNLTLTVNTGELFALLGPNGAGKTTALKLVAGLLKPDAGTIRVCGYDTIAQSSQARSVLAFVPDTPYLYEKLTPWEFVQLVGKLYNLSDKEIRTNAEPLIARLHLEPYLHKYIETLSHGTRQRVAIAAALVHNPRVFIIDEPMVGLDPIHMFTVKRLFQECAKEKGMTIVISTHQLNLAEEIADRIGIIHMGRLIAAGSVEQLRQTAKQDGALESLFLTLTSSSEG